jgi:hypothetical protein
MKFTAEQPLFHDRVEITKDMVPNSPLLKALIEINGIESVFGYHDFITVCKTSHVSWEQVLPKIESILDLAPAHTLN